ncbi:hypothetical protein I3J09_02005 [Streptomyces clavuligerus]|uniref:hypothetical protein n=1 Tax=Streptomyces clavuligerus TaxID=1901 RepID=UPI0008109422|nr:hypothetical protein [Streptomyces clavuligerus]ANW21763.1 hypothetical protein BB341_02030 [Streptomyces clavuligerus]AXU16396.1 hypothetical protein D1794_02135 [Streptomyces clavuligerus]MBY6301455.1 hypothetical protein [Streptomyces clavuligerus]QPL61743.1 hypothetical protein I3J04_02005 [Streptomyces clavuligerus]QPL67776.1 hypothetical protein I3J05_02020 [Streptomyces clavuligerus]
MPTARVSSAVMTHPVRRAQAEELVARLGLGSLALDPDPDGTPSALRTALIAWASITEGATHQFMIQDDVAAPDDMLDLVAHCADRFPGDALAFYTNWHARNGAAARLAALAGAGWVRAVPEEFTPTLAICLPVALADGFRRYAERSGERHDDEVMADFLRRGGRRSALLAVPTVTEHTGTSSINGHATQGVRLAVCPTAVDDARPLLSGGWVLEELDWLPYMRYGQGFIRLPGQDATPAARSHYTWREALPGTKLLTEGAVSDVVRELRPEDAAAEVARLFGPSFADELWIHCLLLGRQAEDAARRHAPEGAAPDRDPAVRRLREAAVSTVGPAGLPPEHRPSVGPAHAELLSAYAWTGISAGKVLLERTRADRR